MYSVYQLITSSTYYRKDCHPPSLSTLYRNVPGHHTYLHFNNCTYTCFTFLCKHTCTSCILLKVMITHMPHVCVPWQTYTLALYTLVNVCVLLCTPVRIAAPVLYWSGDANGPGRSGQFKQHHHCAATAT